MRIRYGDAPSFLDVSSVISAYAFQGQVAAGGQVSSDLTNAIPRSIFTFGGNATDLYRPTITHAARRRQICQKPAVHPLHRARFSSWCRQGIRPTEFCN